MEEQREFSYDTKQENKYKSADNAPTVVKVISILHYLNAGLYLLVALALMIFSGYVVNQIINVGDSNFGLNELANFQELNEGVLKTSIFVMGFIFIGLAVLNFFVARDLWRLRNWARIVAVLLALISFTAQIYNMISGATVMQIINLAINIFIIGYLVFFQEAKEVFKKK